MASMPDYEVSSKRIAGHIRGIFEDYVSVCEHICGLPAIIKNGEALDISLAENVQEVMALKKKLQGNDVDNIPKALLTYLNEKYSDSVDAGGYYKAIQTALSVVMQGVAYLDSSCSFHSADIINLREANFFGFKRSKLFEYMDAFTVRKRSDKISDKDIGVVWVDTLQDWWDNAETLTPGVTQGFRWMRACMALYFLGFKDYLSIIAGFILGQIKLVVTEG
jgi:hypothetical protein